MNIAGWTKSSLINFQKHASTVVFIGGCNFRCGYCHNPEIVFAQNKSILTEEAFFSFLEKRRRFLDGVCITGGEPTLAEGLPDFIKRIKAEGYAVKLDTNGTNPKMMRSLINDKLLDYIAMDIKGPLSLYNEITGVNVDTEKIRESIKLLISGDVDYEFRTTVTKEQIDAEQMSEIGRLLKGCKRYYIQNYRSEGADRTKMSGDSSGQKKMGLTPHPKAGLEELKKIALEYIQEVGMR